MVETSTVPQQHLTLLEKWAQHPNRVITILWALCLLVYLALLPVPRTTKNLFSSDGLVYFEELRSLVIDHDLDISNEEYYLEDKIPTAPVLPKFTVGMAIVWLPFYLTMHLLISAGHLVGLPVSPDGYNVFYQFSVCIGSMVLGYFGLLLILRICREFFKPVIALLATVLITFGWSIVYYLTIENSMSHMGSLLAISSLIAWWRFVDKKRVIVYWAGLGAIAALATMIRPQDGAFLVLPGIDLLLTLVAALRQKQWQASLQPIRNGLILAVAFVIGYTPQLAASYKAFGTPFTNGYSVEGETFDLSQPHLLEVLFSTYHGLFTWHPLMLLAVVGLFFLAKIDRSYTLKLAVAVAIQIYIISCWHAWWEGDSFGTRMLINSTPIFVLGLAAAINYLKERFGWWSVWVIAVVALGWNFLFIVQYRFGTIPRSAALTWKQLTIDKLTVFFDLLHHRGST